jgi:hypothetical protein
MDSAGVIPRVLSHVDRYRAFLAVAPSTKVIEMAKFSSLANKAREIFNQRGGTEAAKGDLQELKDIHARGGSMSDKAKAAVDALKEPGMKGPDRSAPPDEQTPAREGGSGTERR